MRVEAMGERAVRLFDLPSTPASVALACAKLEGVEDAVPASDCVGVYFLPGFDSERLFGIDFGAVFYEGKVHQVPVCYELGEDLTAVSAQLGMSEAQLIEWHGSEAWPCFAVGFCPGFAYLGPVAEALRGVPRLASPRVRTVPGSVGLTGSQTAVYPLVRPGGWPIIGRTPLTLVNVEDRYFPISVGDSVRFIPISMSDFKALEGEQL